MQRGRHGAACRQRWLRRMRMRRRWRTGARTGTRRRGWPWRRSMEGSAWAEFEGFSNNLLLSAIEYMDMGDEACELAYESGVLDL